MLRLVFAAAVMMPACARAATLVGPYPFAVGDAFTFSFHSSETVTNSSGQTTTTQAYTQTTTILAPINYNYPPVHGTVVAYPFDSKATSTTSAGTLTVHNTEYRNFVAGSGGAKSYVAYGYVDTSDLVRSDNVDEHLSSTRVFGSPATLDVLPETSGGVWRLPINNTTTTNDQYENTGSTMSNILQSTFVGNADGSYTDSGQLYNVPYSVSEAASGTGTLDEGPSTATEQWTFQLPTSGSGGEIIPVTVMFDGKTGHNSVPDWFPGHGAAPHPLTAAAIADQGLQTVPAGCGPYSGKSAVKLHQIFSQLGVPGSGASDFDGYTLQETDDYYVVSGVGRVCIVESQLGTRYDSKVSGKVEGTDAYTSITALIKESVH